MRKPPLSRTFFIAVTFLAQLLVTAITAAEPHSHSRPGGGTKDVASTDALGRLVKTLVLEHVPRVYDKLDGWGRTKEIVSGIDVRREGLEIRTHRRRKHVNDGTWKWYRCELVDPQRDLDIRIRPLEDAEDGMTRFDVAATARLHVLARVQQWETGVRLASLSTEADARVRLDLRCRLKLALDTGCFPPDLVFHPHVERAQVRLLDLDVQRISKLRGDLAEEIGRGIRPTLEREIARRQVDLVEKLNTKLAARQKDFRFSLTDWAAKGWAGWMNQAKPASTVP